MRRSKTIYLAKVFFGFTVTLLSSLFCILDILSNSSGINRSDRVTKQNSSLAWGNTHDDGWMD